MTHEPTDAETREIGHRIGDMFVALGHPLTCNGGNRNLNDHHDHEVRMYLDQDTLICPECGRRQDLPPR